MKLISWNLNGLEDQSLDERTEAAMFEILLGAPVEKAFAEGFQPNSPDIVVLQEVVERSYHAHILPHLKAAGFSVFPQQPSVRSYFEMIAVRSEHMDASYAPFEYSEQGRGLTTLKLNDLTIMTSHLESMKPGKIMRLEQAKFILEKMQTLGPCLFAGDTNLRQTEWLSLDKGKVIDAWESIGSPEKHRTTWQYENHQSRFDRAWAHQLRIQNFETFGKDKVGQLDTRASDHLGLRIEFDK